MQFVLVKFAAKGLLMTSEIVQSVEKKKKKYQVITDKNKYLFSEETILKFLIFKDKSLSEKDLQEINKYEKFNLVFLKALNYLSYQARSESEMVKYLLSKEAEPYEVDQIISQLKNMGYLNDEDFVKYNLDYIIRNQKGPKVLEQKLKQKGIDESLIQKALLRYSQEIEGNLIDEIIEKMVIKNKKLPLIKQKQSLYQKLIRDGFSNELVNAAINRVIFIDESDDTLLLELNKLLSKYDVLDYEARTKIINRLMNKGYPYSKVLEALNNLE